MELSKIDNKAFLLLDDVYNPVVTEDNLYDWPPDDSVWIPVLEICKWGYITGTLKPNVKCCWCGHNMVYKLVHNHTPYKCKKCRKRFNVFTKTVYSNKKMPFMLYEYFYNPKFKWSENTHEGYLTIVSFYKIKKKFAFINQLKFDNVFQKWNYLLNYTTTK